MWVIINCNTPKRMNGAGYWVNIFAFGIYWSRIIAIFCDDSTNDFYIDYFIALYSHLLKES